MNVKKEVYDTVISTIGSVLPETGGILGEKDGIICAYYFDNTGSCDRNTYKPDTAAVNKILSAWAEQDIQFVGLVHSHEDKQTNLSCADIVYAQTIMTANNMKEILFPLVLIGDEVRLLMYKVESCGNVMEEELTLV